jgi:hypothetical protein
MNEIEIRNKIDRTLSSFSNLDRKKIPINVKKEFEKDTNFIIDNFEEYYTSKGWLIYQSRLDKNVCIFTKKKMGFGYELCKKQNSK